MFPFEVEFCKASGSGGSTFLKPTCTKARQVNHCPPKRKRKPKFLTVDKSFSFALPGLISPLTERTFPSRCQRLLYCVFYTPFSGNGSHILSVPKHFLTTINPSKVGGIAVRQVIHIEEKPCPESLIARRYPVNISM